MATFGVTILNPVGSIIESLDVEMKGEFKQLINSDGEHSQAQTYDTSYSISVKGKGDTAPYTVGDETPTLVGVSGKGIWTNVSLESKNDDYRGWSASATIYKNAV